MIKAIIFDCFGVLTTEGWLAFKAKHFSHDSFKFNEATILIKRANSGLIGDDEFISEAAKLAGITTSEVYAALRKNVPNEPLFDYIKELKINYRIGMLSNVAGNYLGQLFSSEQLGAFDAISLSYETGMVKPDSRAYTRIAEDLAVEPIEAVLADDQEAYVRGARQAGMRAICYRDLDQFKHELQALLADTKS